jgi:hypothetical protein
MKHPKTQIDSELTRDKCFPFRDSFNHERREEESSSDLSFGVFPSTPFMPSFEVTIAKSSVSEVDETLCS